MFDFIKVKSLLSSKVIIKRVERFWPHIPSPFSHGQESTGLVVQAESGANGLHCAPILPLSWVAEQRTSLPCVSVSSSTK